MSLCREKCLKIYLMHYQHDYYLTLGRNAVTASKNVAGADYENVSVSRSDPARGAYKVDLRYGSFWLEPVERDHPMTALERGIELMGKKSKELPPLAHQFAQHLCDKMGLCGEVVLTALTVYAECVEKLEAADPDYAATAEHVQWFKNQFRLEKGDG